MKIRNPTSGKMEYHTTNSDGDLIFKGEQAGYADIVGTRPTQPQPYTGGSTASTGGAGLMGFVIIAVVCAILYWFDKYDVLEIVTAGLFTLGAIFTAKTLLFRLILGTMAALCTLTIINTATGTLWDTTATRIAGTYLDLNDSQFAPISFNKNHAMSGKYNQGTFSYSHHDKDKDIYTVHYKEKDNDLIMPMYIKDDTIFINHDLEILNDPSKTYRSVKLNNYTPLTKMEPINSIPNQLAGDWVASNKKYRTRYKISFIQSSKLSISYEVNNLGRPYMKGSRDLYPKAEIADLNDLRKQHFSLYKKGNIYAAYFTHVTEDNEKYSKRNYGINKELGQILHFKVEGDKVYIYDHLSREGEYLLLTKA